MYIKTLRTRCCDILQILLDILGLVHEWVRDSRSNSEAWA